MNRSVALILAGGVGSRMNLSIPKQFVVVDGMTVLQHTMLAFQRHQLVSAIYVVASPQWAETVRQQAKEAGIGKFRIFSRRTSKRQIFFFFSEIYSISFLAYPLS